MKKIAVIGAGLSGLTAATQLREHAEVTVFEKSRGPGGRMATRYADPYFFDHGAQFFNPKTEEFISFIGPMIEKGVIKRWDGQFVEILDRNISYRREWGEEYPHYVGSPGMDAIGKYLSRDLNLILKTKIDSLSCVNEKWLIRDEDDRDLGIYDYVVLAMPPIQVKALASSLLPAFDFLDQVTMQACFSLMLAFSNPLQLDFDAALVLNEDISWISANNSKPDRSPLSCLLIHSTNKWADMHIDDNRDEVMEYLYNHSLDIINFNEDTLVYKQLHGWRYANVEKQHGEASFFDTHEKIGVCGDWFIHGRIESAFLSGLDISKKIIEVMD